MTVEQIAGLMLYSAHQAIPSGSTRFGASTYHGKPFAESGAKSSDLSDQQIKFLTKITCVMFWLLQLKVLKLQLYGITRYRLFVKVLGLAFLQTTVLIPAPFNLGC